VERAADLPHRRALIARLDELSREISRELTLATEVVRSELGENCVTVVLGRRCVIDRKPGKPPEDLNDFPHVGRGNRAWVYSSAVKHRRQERLGLADQHALIISLRSPLLAASNDAASMTTPDDGWVHCL
jgi:hypothetical protein